MRKLALFIFFYPFLTLGMSEFEISGEFKPGFIYAQKERLKKMYFAQSKQKRSYEKTRVRATKYDIRKITKAIRSNPGISKEDQEDTLKIFKFLVSLGIEKINLSSAGGELRVIYPLGVLVKEMGLALHIPAGKICASACGFLFHFSPKRSMGEQAKIMYHLGIIYQGEDMFNVNECHVFDMEKCKMSPQSEFVLDKYRKFLTHLPEQVRGEVLKGEDVFVDHSLGQMLGLLN